MKKKTVCDDTQSLKFISLKLIMGLEKLDNTLERLVETIKENEDANLKRKKQRVFD